MTTRRPPPDPGQESVWDYPRPPRCEPTTRHLRVVFRDATVAETRRAHRVLETCHPPVYYLPAEDVRREHLAEAEGSSWCEWKGTAKYFSVVVGDEIAERAVWTYPEPTAEFEAIRGHFAFYPALMDACFVDGERARPQPGGFYGGWITSDVVGPFKGEAGTSFW